MPLQTRSGGPYASNVAGLGGMPSVLPDVPICAVFLVLYMGFAATNMTIFQKNRRRGHKFVLSAMLFGFSMARIITLVLRIVWSNQQRNIQLSIAANIFVNAGVLMVYVINLLLAQRILRAKQPHIGWNPVLRIIYKILYGLVAGALVMVIVATVVSLYTLDMHTRTQCRDVQLAASTYLLILTCLPALHLLVVALLPRSPREESFGQGSMTSKIIILTISSTLCILISGFKVGTAWSPPRPATHPAWFHSKACFYVFNFVLEILILMTLTFNRFDKRFHIPNGSTKPGDYSGIDDQSGKLDSEDASAHVEPKTSY